MQALSTVHVHKYVFFYLNKCNIKIPSIDSESSYRVVARTSFWLKFAIKIEFRLSVWSRFDLKNRYILC